MEEFKYPDPVPLGTDGKDYHILTDAVRRISSVPGITCEIGVRTGGSTKLIVDELSQGRTHIGIDPYGGLPYTFDTNATCDILFTNEDYRNPSLPKIYEYAFSKGINFIFQNMTSAQFMRRFADGVPLYKDGVETIENNYALVFFDGLHQLETVMAETIFFETRAQQGTVFVYDDYLLLYNHEHIDRYLVDRSWKEIARTDRKISYYKST